MSEPEVSAFLSSLATNRDLAANTQDQAYYALSDSRSRQMCVECTEKRQLLWLAFRKPAMLAVVECSLVF